MQRSLQCRISDITDIDPANPAEIIQELTPCLALVAGSGMDTDTRRLWYNAAVRALEGMPIGLVRRGAQAAMVKADHPSKIIPAIIKEVESDWNWRKRMKSPAITAIPYRPERPMMSEAERTEVGGMMRQLVEKMQRTAPQFP